MTLVGPLHPRVTVPVTTGTGATEQIIGRADAYPDPVKALGTAGTIYDAPLASVTTANSGSPDPTQFLQQCLAQAPASQPVPQPTATPGNSDIFQNNLYYPCNICVGNLVYQYDDTSNPPVLHTIAAQSQVISPASPNGPTDWTCNPDHVGCFDLCQYIPVVNPIAVNAGSSLWVVQTAVNLKETSGTRSALACNVPYAQTQ